MGNSHRTKFTSNRVPVHPHMRGEQRVRIRTAQQCAGSSPHAWGTEISQLTKTFCIRFIPTCVGNRTRNCPDSRTVSVHPHMRGEQVNSLRIGSNQNGSSPHAWGTGGLVRMFMPALRFIPTCVGNRCGVAFALHFLAVHPHMRGEQDLLTWDKDKMGGSSPHAWGTVTKESINA